MPELKYFAYRILKVGRFLVVKFKCLGSWMGPQPGVKVQQVGCALTFEHFHLLGPWYSENWYAIPFDFHDNTAVFTVPGCVTPLEFHHLWI